MDCHSAAKAGDTQFLQKLYNVGGLELLSAVDEDGNGQISLEEAVGAPARVASWLGVWRDLWERGKL